MYMQMKNLEEGKKMGSYSNAAKGMKLLFLSQIGAIISAVFAVIPFIGIIGAIAAVVFGVLGVYGLYVAGSDVEGCKKAMILTIVNVVVSLLGSFFWESFFSIVSQILSLAIVYLVCKSIGEALSNIGDSKTAAFGATTSKLYIVCYAIAIVLTIIGLIPLIGIVAKIISVPVAIVELVASIMYIMFCYKSYNSLQ